MPIMRSGPKACTVVGVKDCTMDEKTRQGRLRFCVSGAARRVPE
jgi:hypothetical protein